VVPNLVLVLRFLCGLATLREQKFPERGIGVHAKTLSRKGEGSVRMTGYQVKIKISLTLLVASR
jgi:hypothetical protein